jgi:hypothetical protein
MSSIVRARTFNSSSSERNQSRRDDVAVLRARRRRDHHVVTVEDAATDHRLSLDAKEEDVVARQEAAVHRDEARAMLRQECRLPGVHSAVVGHGLRGRRAREADDADAARARLIALDEPLLRE